MRVLPETKNYKAVVGNEQPLFLCKLSAKGEGCFGMNKKRIKEKYTQGEAVPAGIFRILAGSQEGLLLHTTLLARCSVLHPKTQKECRGGSVFRWTTDLTTIFVAVGEI